MANENVEFTLRYAREEAQENLPDFIRNLPPIPSRLFPKHEPLKYLLLGHPGRPFLMQDRPLMKYFADLNLNGEQESYIYRALLTLAVPRVDGNRVDYRPVTIKTAKELVKRGLLDLIDGFRDDAVRRETARRLLGVKV